MAGIYIHIPFCKQACHYCDFHFSTSLKYRDEMLSALKIELLIRKQELAGQFVETIYFGGGTPSILSVEDIDWLIALVKCDYQVAENAEITIEANPDDLSKAYLEELSKTSVNRLSIGVQSFHEADLKLMNRAHNANEAKQCLEEAVTYFDNISVDLIYGIPGASNAQWLENIETALSLNIPHISSYALTVEPKTALESLIKKGKIANVNDAHAEQQFHMLVDRLHDANFVHYELSNFGKEGFFSKNNSAYWLGKSYLGIGPSAHSFNGKERSWNIANNIKYIKSLKSHKRPFESEKLTLTDRYNEYVMTGLRTIWGVSLIKVERDFGIDFKTYLISQSKDYIDKDFLYLENDNLLATKKGKFLIDGIASQLFKLN